MSCKPFLPQAMVAPGWPPDSPRGGDRNGGKIPQTLGWGTATSPGAMP